MTESEIRIKPVGRRPWPLMLWMAQLAIPGAVVFYAVLRWIHGPSPGPVLWPLAILGLAWCITVFWTALRTDGRRWIRKRRWELLLAFLVTTVMLGVFDLCLTWTGTVPSIREQREHSLEYRGSVATRHRLVAKEVQRPSGLPPIRINRRGLRGPEIETAPPAGRRRILFLGGSSVFDYWGNWPRQVEELMRAQGHGVEVLNGAVPGHSTADSLGKLAADYWTLKPDIVFTCHAWNDIKYFRELTPDHSYLEFMGEFRRDWRIHPEGLDRWLSYSALYRYVRHDLIRALIGPEGGTQRTPESSFRATGPAQFELNLRLLVAATKEIGAVPVLCRQARLARADSPKTDRDRIHYSMVGLDHEALVEAFRQTDEIVARVASDTGVVVIDMDAVLGGRPELFEDHVHFTSEGSAVAAQAVARRLGVLLVEER